MKKTPPQSQNHESAPSKRNFNLGTLPRNHSTVTAAVLAHVLAGNVLTGMDAVQNQSTTRLSGFIYSLNRDYGWEFEHRDIAAGTSDGRISTIRAYWLPGDVRQAAMAAGAGEWITEVQKARAALRKQASKCKAKAAAINARRRDADPRQMDIWGEV